MSELERQIRMFGPSFSQKKKVLTLLDFACRPCAGAMLIFSVSFQF